MSITVERQNDVDHVLERLRPGDRSVLRHVSDNDQCDPRLFRSSDETGRSLPDLCRTPRSALAPVSPHRLDRVDDDDRIGAALDEGNEIRKASLGGDGQSVDSGPDPPGAQSHLLPRLLPACDQHGHTPAGERCAYLQHDGRLPDTRRAAEQGDGTRNDSTADDAIELVDARLEAVPLLGCNESDRYRFAGDGAGRRSRLGQRPRGSTLRAESHPAAGPVRASSALIGGHDQHGTDRV